MPAEKMLARRERLHIPTLHFIYSTTDHLALDCKRLEAMQLAPRVAQQTYYSLYWVIEGTGEVAIDFVEYALGSSTLLLLQPGQVFYPRLPQPRRGLAVFFPRDFLALDALGAANPFPILAGADARALAPLAVSSDYAQQIHQLMGTIAEEFAGQQPGRATMIQAALHMLLVTAGRLRPVAAVASYPGLVQTFFALVEQHFHDVTRPGAYARMLGVTPGHLNDVVRRATGQTASGVLHQRILLEAKRLLAQTDASVSEIAARLAFSDASYFTRFFHRATGLAPTAFRQRIREKS